MSDYKELVKALRCCCPQPEETCDGCPYDTAGECNISRMMRDAAAAIEELQQIADHYEQTAKDYWKEACEYKAQLPKRGEWIDGDARRVTARCSVCGHLRLGNGAEWANKHVHFCEVCGSRMGGEKA